MPRPAVPVGLYSAAWVRPHGAALWIIRAGRLRFWPRSLEQASETPLHLFGPIAIGVVDQIANRFEQTGIRIVRKRRAMREVVPDLSQRRFVVPL